MTKYTCPNCNNLLFLNVNQSDNNRYWRCCKWSIGCKITLKDLNNRPDFSKISIKNARLKMLIKLADKKCPICNHHLILRKSNVTNLFFLGCTQYPKCNFRTWTNLEKIPLRFVTWL